jgi:hypothetical protein
MDRRIITTISAPTFLAIMGSAWMAVATEYFQRLTGRPFYGLAGNHYSVPNWGFAFNAGGEIIAHWTVVIPPNVTFLLLLVSAIACTVLFHRHGVWSFAFVCLVHAFVAGAFGLLAAWYWINVMGVFI